VNEFRFGFTNRVFDVVFPILVAVADNELGLTGLNFANHPTKGAFQRSISLTGVVHPNRTGQGWTRPIENPAVRG